ncbi:MAG: phosphoglucomutase/phosphomannomutase family protein [Deltaproteobacteria bacterium]|uniref:Phosphoglucomutase/phosphomannomutase family protein n=1 Tax=Candidatus Zymogenus saltonus TaxID=2844893 RepID=A0A9D8KFA0_9DELT|nr:phosphoglucomutase/phosphomannomutase family protein [Candidatus Zymogenus saltonus]
MAIKFGTSGWRGVIADDYTGFNVRCVAQAIAEYVIREKEEKEGLIVGYDSRFLGERFAEYAARVVVGNGVRVLFSREAVPTPTIAFGIVSGKAAGAINITASHNPYDYNGIKYSPKWGGPALPETTKWIEDRANEVVGTGKFKEMAEEEARSKGLWTDVDLRPDYLDELNRKIDFAVIKKWGKKVAYDPLFATGKGYLDRALSENGIDTAVIHNEVDPYFGGGGPDPSEEKLNELSRLVKNDKKISLGLATDGDADRFGILDFDGTFIEPNYIIALLLDYLIRVRKFEGGVARTVATTHLIDAVSKYHGVKCYETPVGFKYIGEYISGGEVVGGGEESAGFSIKGHLPEKDGILACLLTLEMVARENKSIKELLDELYKRVGTFKTRRVNLMLTEALDLAFPEKMKTDPKDFADIKIKEKNTIDGTKYILEDGSWILFRKSGTEPVVRIYAEAEDDKELERIIESGKKFILGT